MKKLAYVFFAVLLALAFTIPALAVSAAPAPPPGGQTPLSGGSIPQFVDQLPILDITGAPNGTIKTILAGANPIELHMREFKANMLPAGTVAGYTGTWVWGYIEGPNAPVGTQDTYTGPVIVATRNVPTQINFINNLGNTATTNVLAYKNSTDQSLHWANPNGVPMMVTNPFPPPAMVGNPDHYAGSIPAVPHLHGGDVPPVLDGGPDAWFTSDGTKVGHAYYTLEVTSLPALPNANYPEGTLVRNQADGLYYKVTSGAWAATTTLDRAVYRYPNEQEAAPIWFHDHTLGATRLNVYMGLAGAYDIIDPGLTLPAGLGAVGLVRATPNAVDDTIVPLVIQDRMFDTNGQLYFPNVGINPDHPYWVPEFIGDTIAVNGKVWPYLNVKAQRYRFLLVNGSNARTYELSFQVSGKGAPPTFWQIGTDQGYLNGPVAVPKLILMPGERADVIVDFAGIAPGTNLILQNTAKAPYPGGAPPQGSTVGRIMQFRVVTGAAAVDDSFNPAAAGVTIRGGAGQGPAIVPLVGATPNQTRQLTLNEVMGMKMKVGGVQFPGGPLEILVNNTKWSGLNPDGTTRTDFTAVTIGGNTTYYSELPHEGDTEVWELINLTADAHPIHLHLTQFQLVNREAFNVKGYLANYAAVFPGGGIDPMTGLPYAAGVYMPSYGPPLDYNTGNPNALGGNPDITAFLSGVVLPPAPNEAGWKDTIMAPPGMVTRIVVRWAPMTIPIGGTGGDPTTLHYQFDPNAKGHGYVWHCHIVDHEDNEMMRPDIVVPMPLAPRTYVIGIDY